MKKIIFSIVLLATGYLVNGQVCNGATQLTLLGSKNNGIFKQLELVSYSPNSADPSNNEIYAGAWTCNGMGYPICNFRAIAKYNLSQIPVNAIIVSANLYLYARPNSTNALVGSPTFGANNAVSISRVTTNWDSSGIGAGWNTQPQTTNVYQVTLPTSTSIAQNYVANLINLVQFWTNKPDSNFGMQFKIIDETSYKSMIFNSGTSVASLQPRLEICYWTEEQYPSVVGTAFYDANNNGIKDSTEVVAPFAKVGLSNGNFTFTDINGYYEIAAKTLGNYDVNVTAPNFYTSTNLNTSYTFTNYGQRFQNDIPFVATSNTDSLNVHIIPYYGFARPGFEYPCFIDYENLGNTILTPTVAIGFDSTKQSYDSCSQLGFANVGNIFGGIVSMPIKPGERHFFTGYLTNKASLLLTDTIRLAAAINAGLAWAVDEVVAPVRGSFDPNDIEATAMLTPTQVANGKYIDYTIRFENIGTDTAINIEIKDTLSSWLQASTLQMISSSAACKVTVNGKYVRCQFKNIKLLYHSLNAIKSMGFVKFRVKPYSSVFVGLSIPNKASIYFDFNAPITTNTASTIIKNATVLPLKIINYKASPTPSKDGFNNWSVANNWQTTNEVNVSNFAIERSTNGKVFEPIGKIPAHNKANNEYSFIDQLKAKDQLPNILYYRIASIDKDGSQQFSETKKVQLGSTTTQPISVYPNPATSIVNIECVDAKQIVIIDCLGRVVKQCSNSSQTINTTQFKKGIYVVKAILNSGEIKTEKLIVE
jgi:uncharacterized repeat protein (TIGR01451 family)